MTNKKDNTLDFERAAKDRVRKQNELAYAAREEENRIFRARHVDAISHAEEALRRERERLDRYRQAMRDDEFGEEAHFLELLLLRDAHGYERVRSATDDALANLTDEQLDLASAALKAVIRQLRFGNRETIGELMPHLLGILGVADESQRLRLARQLVTRALVGMKRYGARKEPQARKQRDTLAATGLIFELTACDARFGELPLEKVESVLREAADAPTPQNGKRGRGYQTERAPLARLMAEVGAFGVADREEAESKLDNLRDADEKRRKRGLRSV